MADIYLDANEENYPLAGADDRVFGRPGGSESVVLLDGASAVFDGNVEGVTLPGAVADFDFLVDGTTVQIFNGGTLVAEFSGLSGVVQLTFDDVAADLELTGLDEANLGNTPLPTDAAGPVDPEVSQSMGPVLTADVDTLQEGGTATFTIESDLAEGTELAYTISGVDVADIAGDSLTGTVAVDADGNATFTVDVENDGVAEGDETLTVTLDDYDTATDSVTITDPPSETIVLTTEDDVETTTPGLDTTFDGTGVNTLNPNDVLIDDSTTDSDVLNATITNANKGNIAPRIDNVENVNLDLQVITGAQFDADNTSGATISAFSSTFGFNGKFEVDNAGDNNIMAGANVTELTVNLLEGGTVDAGSADTVDIDTDSASDDVNLILNGDADLTVATSDTLNLMATADTAIDLVPGALEEIAATGAFNITIEGDFPGLEVITGVTTVTQDTDLAANLDASEWDVPNIVVDADLAGNTLTLADGATVELQDTQAAGSTIEGQGTSSATITSSVTNVGALTFAEMTSVDLMLTGNDPVVAQLDAADVSLTVVVSDDTTLTDVEGEDVVLTGEGDVELDEVAGGDLESLDASTLDGDLDVTGASVNDQDIVGAMGDNTVTFAATGAGQTAAFVGQDGNDDVTFAAVAGDVDVTISGGNNTVTLAGAAFAGEANVVFGSGNDTLELNQDFAAGGILVGQFGEGTNTLQLADGADQTNGTFAFTGLDGIALAGRTATVGADMLTGQSYSVRGANGVANDTLTVDLDAAGETADLSGLDASDSATVGANFIVSGDAGEDTITGTSIADAIITGGDSDTLAGDGGDDFFVVTDGVGADGIEITDFDSADDAILIAGVAATQLNTTMLTSLFADFQATTTTALFGPTFGVVTTLTGITNFGIGVGTATIASGTLGAQQVAGGTHQADAIYISGASAAAAFGALTLTGGAASSVAFRLLFLDTDGTNQGLYLISGSLTVSAASAVTAYSVTSNQAIVVTGSQDVVAADITFI